MPASQAEARAAAVGAAGVRSLDSAAPGAAKEARRAAATQAVEEEAVRQ
jgi:hypothetical protein